MVKFENVSLLGDDGLLWAGEISLPEANDGDAYISGYFAYDRDSKPRVFIAEAPINDEISTGVHELGHALSDSESFLRPGDQYEVALGHLRQLPNDQQAAKLVRMLEDKSKGLLPSRFRKMSLDLPPETITVLRELYGDPKRTLSATDSRQAVVKGVIVSLLQAITSGFRSIDQSAITILSQSELGTLATGSEPQRTVSNDRATRNVEVGAVLVEAIGMMIWENTLRKYQLFDFEYEFRKIPSAAHTRAFNLVRRAFEHDMLLPSDWDLRQDVVK